MILITGATGQFGKGTIDFLLQKGISANNISALARDEAKAQELKAKGVNLKIGDYDNYASLLEAFKGVNKLLFVSGSDVQKRDAQHESIVKAAKEAGVKHIVYTSFERRSEADSSPIALVAKTHIETEKQIRASGIAYTILRNSLYADVLPMFLGQQVLETGVFYPAGEGKASFATRSDMAEAAANILTSEGHENKEYTIANTENISFRDIANILSDVSERNILYISPDTQVYIDTLSKAGVPAEYAGIISGFAEAIKQGEFYTERTDLENLLGRKPASVKEYMTQVYSIRN